MLFNSFDFLIFFPIVTLVYFLIPQRVKYLWLLAASYYFYMCWNPKYALLIFASTGVTFLSGILIGRAKSVSAKKWAVFGSFVINLAILFLFKYFYFALGNINAVRAFLNLPKITPRFDIVLPVGISFYTFQALSYTADVYRGEVKPEKNFFKYALFVSFFPQLVAGPIERSKNLLKQVNGEHHFDYLRVRKGLLTMIWGFFLKLVIADRAAVLVNTVYDNISAFDGAYIALATLCFAVQIYCDFASYSTIAIGAAEVMGFNLMQNFNMPYFAVSIADFWRRWHISLSTWFRDYLYIPLGGNRKGRVRKYLNTMIVFLVSGLWHGASWHFVVWGAIHGIYQIAGGITDKARQKIRKALRISDKNFMYLLFRRAVTFLLVSFAWIFFRSAGTFEAWGAIERIALKFNAASLINGGIAELGLDIANLWVLFAAVLVLVAVSILKNVFGDVAKKAEKTNIFVRWVVYLLLIFTVLIFGIYGPGFEASQFIYFQF
ncbi:MAG: MBOAT family protein [Clostridia bacterium]|nr:MBOAT family protein [Clostridia bacterium]